MMTNPIEWSIDAPSLEAFTRGMAAGDAQPEWFRIRREAEELALRPAFDQLITLHHNTIKELPHQIKVALSRPMVGRAILADEVGLGIVAARGGRAWEPNEPRNESLGSHWRGSTGHAETW